MPKITIHLPEQEPLKIGFEDQVEVTIGRADDNDIVAVHDSISSHHAALRLVDSQYILVDLESTNGTFYDGAPVTELPLEHGMRVLLGQVEADYEADEAPATEEPTSEGESEFASSGGSGFESSIHATLADQSVRPADFNNLSPLPKVEKSDGASKVAMLIGVVGIVAAGAMVAFAFMMKV